MQQGAALTALFLVCLSKVAVFDEQIRNSAVLADPIDFVDYLEARAKRPTQRCHALSHLVA